MDIFIWLWFVYIKNQNQITEPTFGGKILVERFTTVNWWQNNAKITHDFQNKMIFIIHIHNHNFMDTFWIMKIFIRLTK